MSTNATVPQELAYVGRRPCGCVGLLMMVPQSGEKSNFARDAARELAKCKRWGWMIETLPVEQARQLSLRCEHTRPRRTAERAERERAGV